MPKLALSFRFYSKIFIYTSLLVVFYIEIVSYSLLNFQWRQPPKCYPPKCSKVLLVADPQIIGSKANGYNAINILEIWDSDRYIKRTFLQAFHYIRPQVIIFLGDVMDNGHFSSDHEFFIDLKRFLNIFELSSQMNNIQKVFLPGDNDIGGIDDIMIPQVVHRFNKIFNQSDGPFSLELLEFYKVNVMTYEMQEPNYLDLTDTESSLRVALSHVPLLPSPTQFLQRVVKRIRPHLIFSGHAHLSSHFIASETDIWKRKFNNILPNDTKWKTYNLHAGLLHEIVVPTCSYRMGVKNMGYGVAFIDTQNKLLHYNVLWLPRRFTQLFIYIAILIIFIILTFFSLSGRLVRQIRRLIFHIFSIKKKSNTLVCP